MPGTWLREEQADLAALKILDGAAQAFVDLGVSRAGMGEIARYAGCLRGSEVIGCLADAFVSNLQGEPRDAPSSGMRARWMVRVIVSLLTMPGDSEEEERVLIERFVVPSVLSNNDRGLGPLVT